jgi:hypothetical protein
MNSKPKSLKSNPSVLLRLTRIATKYIDSPRLILQDKIDFPLAGLLILKFDYEESFPIFLCTTYARCFEKRVLFKLIQGSLANSELQNFRRFSYSNNNQRVRIRY